MSLCASGNRTNRLEYQRLSVLRHECPKYGLLYTMCFHFSLKRLVVELQGVSRPPAMPSGRFQSVEKQLILQDIHPLPKAGTG
jgi:hypothetical protein